MDTFQNGQWADICILLTYWLKLSSIDRLGTGNVICLALFLARRESPGQSLNVASRSSLALYSPQSQKL